MVGLVAREDRFVARVGAGGYARYGPDAFHDLGHTPRHDRSLPIAQQFTSTRIGYEGVVACLRAIFAGTLKSEAWQYLRRKSSSRIHIARLETHLNAGIRNWLEVRIVLIESEKANEKRKAVLTPDFNSYVGGRQHWRILAS